MKNPRAKPMLVGEQPGDSEDREGHPFVGPAGRILDQALREIATIQPALKARAGQVRYVIQRGGDRSRREPTGSCLQRTLSGVDKKETA